MRKPGPKSSGFFTSGGHLNPHSYTLHCPFKRSMPRARKSTMPRIRSVSLQFNTAGMTADELADYLSFAQELIRNREESTPDTVFYFKPYLNPRDPELLRVFNVRATCDSDVLQIILRKELLPPLRALHQRALERLTAPAPDIEKVNTKGGEHA